MGHIFGWKVIVGIVTLLAFDSMKKVKNSNELLAEQQAAQRGALDEFRAMQAVDAIIQSLIDKSRPNKQFPQTVTMPYTEKKQQNDAVPNNFFLQPETEKIRQHELNKQLEQVKVPNNYNIMCEDFFL